MTTQELIGWVESFTSDSEPYRSAIAAKLRAAEIILAAWGHGVSFNQLGDAIEAYRAAGETK